MNIKSLRKNYDNLTMLQRLAIADQALGRDDEIESLSIKNASPRISYTQTDFSETFSHVLHCRLCTLIARLAYLMNYDYFNRPELDLLINKSNFSPRKDRSGALRLSAYLYVRATDAWQTINDELGLRTNFEEEFGKHFFAIELLNARDKEMRAVAFTQEEARAYLLKECGVGDLQTVEDEIAAYRKYLGIDEP